jgi:hypothetical protein
MKLSKLKKLGLNEEQIAYIKSLKSKNKQFKQVIEFLLPNKYDSIPIKDDLKSESLTPINDFIDSISQQTNGVLGFGKFEKNGDMTLNIENPFKEILKSLTNPDLLNFDMLKDEQEQEPFLIYQSIYNLKKTKPSEFETKIELSFSDKDFDKFCNESIESLLKPFSS